VLVQSIGCATHADNNRDVDERGTAARRSTCETDSELCPAPSTEYDEFLAAKVHISQHKYRESLGELGHIATKTPEEEALKLVLLGESYEGLVDSARAFAAYEKAESLAPEISVAILCEGVLDYKQGDLLRARDLLSRYVRLEGGNAEAFYYLFLCEYDADRKALLARKVILLDASGGVWSTRLFRLTEKGSKRGLCQEAWKRRPTHNDVS
jgi:tetratricopeptide (TPR) repeat protein